MKELTMCLVIFGSVGGALYFIYLLNKIIEGIAWFIVREKVILTKQEIEKLNNCKHLWQYEDVVNDICNKRNFSWRTYNYNKSNNELYIK